MSTKLDLIGSSHAIRLTSLEVHLDVNIEFFFSDHVLVNSTFAPMKSNSGAGLSYEGVTLLTSQKRGLRPGVSMATVKLQAYLHTSFA